MSVSFIYLLHRVFYRVYQFIYDWYIASFFLVLKRTKEFIFSFEQVLAVRITLQNLFQPLYQDFTVVGYAFGFIFRVLRVVFGVLLYPCFVAIAGLIYLTWAMVPFFIFYYGLRS